MRDLLRPYNLDNYKIQRNFFASIQIPCAALFWIIFYPLLKRFWRELKLVVR